MDFDRKLDRQISDLDDIRIIMETQKKIRDQEIDMDMKIDLVSSLTPLAFYLLLNFHFLFVPGGGGLCVAGQVPNPADEGGVRED